MEIAGLIISILSLVATIAVSFSIYWLQSRHEKEIQNLNEIRKQEALAESAKVFIIDNWDEIDYLPLCVIAESVNKYKKHTRKIITRFNKCSPELQTEILRQQNIPLALIKDDNWLDKYIETFDNDADKYFLGRSLLYGGAKYLNRNFDYYGPEEISDANPYIFDVPIMSDLVKRVDPNLKSDLGLYIDRYLEFVLKYRKDTADKPELLPQVPPFDLIYANFHDSDEEVFCFWVMLLVKYSCIAFFRHKLIKNGDEDWRQINIGDAPIETHEDLYYETLLNLYAAYAEEDHTIVPDIL